MSVIKAGHYYVCKHHGDNGDLIVGRVKSVRTTGEVVFVNLLTEARSVKETNVVLRRNKRVKKEDAIDLLEFYKKRCEEVGERSAKKEARERAVGLASFPSVQLDLPFDGSRPRRARTPRPGEAERQSLTRLKDLVEKVMEEIRARLGE